MPTAPPRMSRGQRFTCGGATQTPSSGCGWTLRVYRQATPFFCSLPRFPRHRKDTVDPSFLLLHRYSVEWRGGRR